MGQKRSWGGAGTDILEGGAGHDSLYGGTDADTFVFDLSDSIGLDTIFDFNAGGILDVLEFSDVGGTMDLAALDAITTVSESAGNVTFSFDASNSIQIDGAATGGISDIFSFEAEYAGSLSVVS